MDLKHGVDEMPKISELMLISFQWLVIVVPILVIGGRIVAELHYDSAIEKTVYMQKVFLISALSLIIQVIFGHKLPLITGPAAVLIVGIYAALESGYETIYTSIAICGLIVSLFAITGKLGLIQKVFTQNVISLVFLLIAFSLSPLILDLLSSEGPVLWNILFFILFTLTLLVLNFRLAGFWNSILLILAMVLGSIFYILFNPIELEFFTSQNFEFLNVLPRISFGLEVFLAFLLCYVALVVNDLSSMISLGKLLNVEKLERRVGRGILITGLLNTFSGVFGAIGPVNYAMSPGVITVTKSASRFALIPAGIMILFISFSPFAISLFSAIPKAVIASIFMFILSIQVALALKTMKVEDVESGIIIAFPLILCILVTFLSSKIFPLSLKPILGNGFFLGIIFAVLLEHLLRKNSSKRNKFNSKTSSHGEKSDG